MTQLGVSLAYDVDGNNVDPHRVDLVVLDEVKEAKHAVPVLLLRVHGKLGHVVRLVSQGKSRLDLDEHDASPQLLLRLVHGGDNINLACVAAPVHVEDAIAVRREVARRDSLALGPKLLRGVLVKGLDRPVGRITKSKVVILAELCRGKSASDIILCAPTGKAQMRMKQALDQQLENLYDAECRAKIAQIGSSTIHRLLSWSPQNGTFRYNRKNPLLYSIFIVDECSMISQSLMVRLLEAVPEDASVILLGDRYQLSSVEPGSVFGDFCAILRDSAPHCLAELTVSRRFPQGGEICTMKDRINGGEAESAWDYMKQDGLRAVASCDVPPKNELRQFLQNSIRGTWLSDDGPARYFEEDCIDDAWRRFEMFRILTPFNAGPYGADNLNKLVRSILRFPDVLDVKKADIITEENWPLVDAAFDAALAAVEAFRSQEGAVLYKDVTSRVAKILSIYDEVEGFEPERIETVKARLLKSLEELQQKPDPNRFEQELIFYLEKYDINEEKVRLRQHCRYFMETIDGEPYPGKKLGFIIQEMGREINTTGSKANHAGIQQCVVRMKDELEKIREQSMNIL